MEIWWIKLVALFSILFVKNFASTATLKSSTDELQCKDENNQLVDWFVMYKIPKIRESSNPTIRNGIAYLYMTSETVATGWQLSDKDVTLKNSIPGNTLSPLYQDDVAGKSMWVMYNDHSPESNNVNAKYGHAKGVVMTNNRKGFWLIHSVPAFPATPNAGIETKTKKVDEPTGEYKYPESGTHYGQSFFCISVNSDQIDVIALQLMYNQIITYRKNLPESLVSQYPIFFNASNQVRIKKPPYNKKATLRSTAGLEFISFAKSDKWQKDLYDDFVGPQLNSDLLVETWLNGRGKLPSECNGSRVLNVESIILKQANVHFTSSHDHSKWAVSATGGKNQNWVCIGDINRADTQFNRGGGTVCLNSPVLWPNYKSAVNDVEPCPRKKKMDFSGNSKIGSLQKLDKNARND